MKVWYSIQNDGSVRFMESKELCELNQQFWCSPSRRIPDAWIGCLDIESTALCLVVATIESEIERIQKTHPYPRENYKLKALEILKTERDIVEKVFKIRMPRIDGEPYLSASSIEHSLTHAQYTNFEITVEEVE